MYVPLRSISTVSMLNDETKSSIGTCAMSKLVSVTSPHARDKGNSIAKLGECCEQGTLFVHLD